MLGQLDAVVQEVLDDGRHVTPAEVQGDLSLREAVMTQGADAGARGRFVLDGAGAVGAALQSQPNRPEPPCDLCTPDPSDPIAAITNYNNLLSSVIRSARSRARFDCAHTRR